METCDVQEAVLRVDAEDNPVRAFPASGFIAQKALGLDDDVVNQNSELVKQAEARFRRRSNWLASFYAVLSVAAAGTFLHLLGLEGLTLALSAVLFGFFLFIVIELFVGDNTPCRGEVLNRREHWKNFRYVAATALRDGCSEDAVMEAALAANGNFVRFRRIVGKMTGNP